jgi:hypothetical protein
MNYTGRATVSPTNPIAFAECDRCRFLYNRTQLGPQYQWAGAGLIDTGLRVCFGSGTRRCMDKPFEQYKVLILPPDPIPVQFPRPSPDVTPPGNNPQQPLGYSVNQYIPLPTDPYNQGFTPFNLGGVSPAATPWTAAQGTPQTGGFPPGYPNTKAAVLAAIASASGIPLPVQVLDYSTTIARPSVSQAWFGAQPARSWLLMFSPAGPLSGFSETMALLGATTTLLFGPGQAWFWADAQMLSPTYRGAIACAGLVAGMPLWAWQSATPNIVKLDGRGNPLLDGYGHWELF